MKSNMAIWTSYFLSLWKVKNKYTWFIRFAVFLVHEYRFNADILTISFFILFSAKDWLIFMMNSISCFKFSSTSLGQSKLKQNVLESLITIIFSSLIIVPLLCWCKRYSICLISFFNLYELFPALFVLMMMEV